MPEESSSPLLSLVKDQGLIDDLQYEEVAAEARRSGMPVYQVLQDSAVLDADSILQAMANHLGTEVISLNDREVPQDVIDAIPANTARMYHCVPVEFANGAVRVAFANPLDPAQVDEVGFVVKKDIQVVVADPADIEKSIDRFYGQDSGDISALLKELGADEDIAREAAAAEADERAVTGLINEVPIVKFVHLVLQQAVQDRASDIHFEPFEDEFRIRYRVDGALYEMAPPPKHLALPVVSRIKVMANLNISERRLPQDGRINLPIGNRMIDLRVSTLPTQFGESVVLRVLDRAAVSLDLELLGFPKYVYDYATEAIQRPNGIFIVTGQFQDL